jgi:hypothetical protein
MTAVLSPSLNPGTARSARSGLAGRWLDPLLLGGFSVGMYLIVRFVDPITSDYRYSSFAALAVWSINYPHFAATSMRLYRDRSALQQFPITTVVFPLVMVALTVAALLSPTVLAPAVVKLYLIWSPYHFSGQTVGIALLMAKRAGFTIHQHERWTMWVFVVSTFAYPTTRAETGRGTSQFYDVQMLGLGLPSIVPQIARTTMWATGIALVVLAVLRLVTQRQLVPLAVVIPPLAQLVWFVGYAPAGFTYLVPMFHSLQYLVIAIITHLHDRVDHADRHPVTTGRWWLFGHAALWYAVACVGGVMLFWAFPKLGELTGASPGVATAVVFATVQLHHFVIDGVIWKLSGTGAAAARASLPGMWRRVSA